MRLLCWECAFCVRQTSFISMEDGCTASDAVQQQNHTLLLPGDRAGPRLSSCRLEVRPPCQVRVIPQGVSHQQSMTDTEHDPACVMPCTAAVPGASDISVRRCWVLSVTTAAAAAAVCAFVVRVGYFRDDDRCLSSSKLSEMTQHSSFFSVLALPAARFPDPERRENRVWGEKASRLLRPRRGVPDERRRRVRRCHRESWAEAPPFPPHSALSLISVFGVCALYRPGTSAVGWFPFREQQLLFWFWLRCSVAFACRTPSS